MIPSAQEALELGQKHNIKIMLEHGRLTPSIATDQSKLNELDQVIAQVKDNPALECYYLFDEPKASDFPAVAKLVSFIRERDPKHFCFVNLLPMYGVPGYAVPNQPGVDPSKIYMDFVKQYIKTVKPDLLSYDYYNFMTKNGLNLDQGGYFVNLGLIRQCAREARIPFINIIQACKWDKNFRLPSAAELRWQVYTTLAYGGRGISYFLYWGPEKYGGIYRDGKPTSMVNPIVQLNKEMQSLSKILMGLESVEVFNTMPMPGVRMKIPERSPVQMKTEGAFVLGLFSSKKGRTDHFMLVNVDYNQVVPAIFSLKGGDLSRFDRDTGKWRDCSANGGQYSFDLQPGDGQLFAFNPEKR